MAKAKGPKKNARNAQLNPIVTAPQMGSRWILAGMLILIFLAYWLIFDLLGGGLLRHNGYDTYTLQAAAWMDGRTSLSPDTDWGALELAIYEGEYYVSFPPFPSVVMLPLVWIFGTQTPSNLVVVCTVMLTAAFCYECFRKIGASARDAAFWGAFYACGCSLFTMPGFGGVWFIAQGLNMVLTTGALWALLCHKRVLSLILLALAVGCRPFTIFLLLGVLAESMWKIFRTEKLPVREKIWFSLRLMIVPAIIGFCYLVYNYVRFDNPLEFGHNYLPEFQKAEKGQFDLSYIGDNLERMFHPIAVNEDMTLSYPSQNGFMFWLTNPLFVVWAYYLVRDIRQHRFERKHLLICLMMAANLFGLLVHRTFGGWQFGSRYTIDLLPYVLWYLLTDKVQRPSSAEIFIGIGAIMLNAYGAVAFIQKIHFRS